MKINGLNGTNLPMGGMNMKATDSVSKNIQNQIANAQKQLQDISANKDMSIEEKMKKRQEILQEITDLNNQLRQHQMEMRKEKQQAKGSSMNDMLGGNSKHTPKAGKQSGGLSQASMKAIMSADSAMAQAQVQGSVATRMEGRAGVLESEIKLDSARGGNVEAKKEELAEVQQKASAAQEAQLSTLADANRELEEAAKADRNAEKAEDKKNDKKADKKDVVSSENEDKSVADTEETEAVCAGIKNETVSADVAELAEDYAPKTEEERKEEMVEEALGMEEKGGLTEKMEEVQDIIEEMADELSTENAKLLDEAMTAESEVLAETAVLPPEEVKYKKIDILI